MLEDFPKYVLNFRLLFSVQRTSKNCECHSLCFEYQLKNSSFLPETRQDSFLLGPDAQVDQCFKTILGKVTYIEGGVARIDLRM